MSHRIDMTHNRANIAYLGSRQDVWHRLGFEMPEGASLQDWIKQSGLDWSVEQMPIYATQDGDKMHLCEGWLASVRSDTKKTLGIGSERRKEVQPLALAQWFDEYIKHDQRFKFDVLGALDGGRVIWGSALFQDDVTVAGDKHKARLYMSTAYDGTMSTINRGTMTRVICANTMHTCLADKQKSIVRTRHSTRFDAAKVGQELSTIIQGFDAYKAMGDAMATKHLGDDQIVKMFRTMLDIKPEDTSKDLSTRKLNQFDDLTRCYQQTCRETDKGTAWAALNAVTRYVDHNRSTRGAGASADEARFVSAQFGSGAAMKEQAVQYLDDLCDGDLLRAVSARTAGTDDVSAMLKQSFRSSIGN